MKHITRYANIRKTLWILSGTISLSIICSCTTMKYRHQQWEKTVTRSPDGLLDFAQPKAYGHGDHALLLVHGFGDSPAVWSALAPELARRGYFVYAMRLPGWGEPIDQKRNLTLDDWEEAIIREVEILNQNHTRVAVLAHSLGGCLSTVIAQDQRLPANALVLYAPMLEVSSARSPLLKTRTWFKIGDKILPDKMIIESLFSDHARVTQPRPKSQRDPFNPKNIFRMLYAEMDRFATQAPEMNLPLRLVLPGEDRVVETQRAREWFNILQAPDKDLYIEEPAGHVMPLDMDVLAESDRLVIWLTQQGIAPKE